MCPVFTSIGLALGAGVTSALAVGVGATALTAGAIGVGAYAAGGGFGGTDNVGSVDSRVEAATGTGALTKEEATSTAKKRAYRAGIISTSPTGLDTQPSTSSVKLK